MSRRYKNKINKQKDEGEILYEEIIEVEVVEKDPKELAYNRENFISPENPMITRLFPPKRTLSNHNSTSIIYRNNKIAQGFYNQYIPNFQNNNLQCTCGFENYLNNKRHYSSKNIRKSNSLFSHENRRYLASDGENMKNKNLSISNYSMPTCTCGLTKNYSFSNFRRQTCICGLNKRENNKFICNCPCEISHENHQNRMFNNRRPSTSYEPNFKNRSQKQMIINMSAAGEEMNNLAKNINLKMSNYPNIMNQNRYLKIPNNDNIPHTPSYYFDSNSYSNYNINEMPRLYHSQDNFIKSLCPRHQYLLKNKNLRINGAFRYPGQGTS